jgi:hypothetical protein
VLDHLRFHTVELNGLGWCALLAPGVVFGGVVGVVSGVSLEGLAAAAALGALASWGMGLLVDRLRDRRSFTNLGVEDPASVAKILGEAGIETTEGESYANDGRVLRYVTVQNKNVKRAETLLGWRPR